MRQMIESDLGGSTTVVPSPEITVTRYATITVEVSREWLTTSRVRKVTGERSEEDGWVSIASRIHQALVDRFGLDAHGYSSAQPTVRFGDWIPETDDFE